MAFHIGALSTHLFISRRVRFKMSYLRHKSLKAALAIQSARSRQGISGVRIQKDFARGSMPWCRKLDPEGYAWGKFRPDSC